MEKLYLYQSKIYQWNPLGLQAAALRVKDLHRALGVSRPALYNYFNGKSVPREDKIPALLQHAPECLVLLKDIQPKPTPALPVTEKKPSLDSDLLKSAESRKLLDAIGKAQQASKNGWVRFSQCYVKANVQAATAYAILDQLKVLDVVSSKVVATGNKGPAPLEISYKGDPAWLLR
jgi:transcriptional regulator with XRE-family HTH domain